MARRILSVRQLDRALADPAGLRFVVTRAIPLGDGAVLAEGADVTEGSRAWPDGVLRTHVKRGFIAAIRTSGDARRAGAVASLERLDSGARKEQIRMALVACGTSVPRSATIDELRLLRAAVLHGHEASA